MRRVRFKLIVEGGNSEAKSGILAYQGEKRGKKNKQSIATLK